MFYFFLLILLLAVIVLYDWSVRRTKKWKMLMKQFPGDPPLPIVGNILHLGASTEAIQKNLYKMWKNHGMKNFRVALGSDLVVMLCEAEDTKIILSSTTEINKSEKQCSTVAEHFGNSLVNSSGDHWRTMRKILTPSFHIKLLEQYLVKANSEANALVQVFSNYVDQPAVDIYHDIEACTFNIITSSAMGIESGSADEDKMKYLDACRRIPALYLKKLYSLIYQNEFIYRHSALGKEGTNIRVQLEQSVESIIRRQKEHFERNVRPLVEKCESVEEFLSTNRTKLTVVDVLLLSRMPDGSPLPDKVLREETHVMIFAGYDTTASTSSFALSNLAKYKDLQKKAYQEQLEIFGDDLEREPTLRDLNEMKYLKRFIDESLRMYSTVPTYTRQIKKNLVLHDGKIIPAGTNIMFYIPGIHTNPNYFKNPKEFNPDRFLEPMVPYSFIPFSAGPRACIGLNFAWMSMKAMISKILRHYELSLEDPSHEPIPLNEVILTSTNGHKIKFTKRQR